MDTIAWASYPAIQFDSMQNGVRIFCFLQDFDKKNIRCRTAIYIILQIKIDNHSQPTVELYSISSHFLLHSAVVSLQFGVGVLSPW